MDYLIPVIVGYLLGSIPFAYIIPKYLKGIDISKEGSGTVGTLNSYEVTESKSIGIIVLILDVGKGLLAVFLIKLLISDQIFIYPAIALASAVAGHCFPVWLKFKGGRGLATAAGGSILLIPAVLGLWAVLWLIAFAFRKNIHFGNISATVLTAALVITSADILNKYSTPPAENPTVYALIISLTLLIIMIKHIKPLKDWIGIRKKQIKER